MSHMSFMCFSPTRKLLSRQGVGSRAVSVRNRSIKRWVLWSFIFTGFAVFYVWSRVQVIQFGYEITSLNGRLSELSKQAGALELTIAELKSPKRLMDMATKVLNMKIPDGEQIVLVKP